MVAGQYVLIDLSCFSISNFMLSIFYSFSHLFLYWKKLRGVRTAP